MGKKKFNIQPKELPILKSVILQRRFNYSKGEVTLDFTLDIKSKKLKDFRECMVEAIKDVDETLAEIDN